MDPSGFCSSDSLMMGVFGVNLLLVVVSVVVLVQYGVFGSVLMWAGVSGVVLV